MKHEYVVVVLHGWDGPSVVHTIGFIAIILITSNNTNAKIIKHYY